MENNINGVELLKKIGDIKVKLASDKKFNGYDFGKMKYALSIVESEVTSMILKNKPPSNKYPRANKF